MNGCGRKDGKGDEALSVLRDVMAELERRGDDAGRGSRRVVDVRLRGAPCARRVLLVVLPPVPHIFVEVVVCCADFVDEGFALCVGGNITRRGG